MQHRPRKRFGQHFLHDEQIITMLAEAILAPSHRSGSQARHYIEIGPGRGALTAALVEKVDHLTAIELDNDLVTLLRQNPIFAEKLTLLSCDVLNCDFSTLPPLERALHVFGNLPYNISTPILFHCLRYATRIEQMIFMLQKEVVDRMIAPPGTKQYGRLTVMLDYHCHVEHLFDVSKTAFKPIPQVESSVVRLIPRPPVDTYTVANYTCFSAIVKEAFNHRRKTLANALKKQVSPQQCLACDIDPMCRPEMLTTQDFVKLSNIICL